VVTLEGSTTIQHHYHRARHHHHDAGGLWWCWWRQYRDDDDHNETEISNISFTHAVFALAGVMGEWRQYVQCLLCPKVFHHACEDHHRTMHLHKNQAICRDQCPHGVLTAWGLAFVQHGVLLLPLLLPLLANGGGL
jgi:hypothetical protein